MPESAIDYGLWTINYLLLTVDQKTHNKAYALIHSITISLYH